MPSVLLQIQNGLDFALRVAGKALHSTKGKNTTIGKIMSDDDDSLPPKLLIAKVKGFPWWPALVCLRVFLRVYLGL